jgi:hypothetical protein
MSVKAYEEFHDAQSSLLIKRGKALVKLGVPQGTKDEHKDEFAKGLIRFNQALAKFKSDAKNGNNEQLTASYSALHDTFEMLADMLPRG